MSSRIKFAGLFTQEGECLKIEAIPFGTHPAHVEALLQEWTPKYRTSSSLATDTWREIVVVPRQETTGDYDELRERAETFAKVAMRESNDNRSISVGLLIDFADSEVALARDRWEAELPRYRDEQVFELIERAADEFKRFMMLRSVDLGLGLGVTTKPADDRPDYLDEDGKLTCLRCDREFKTREELHTHACPTAKPPQGKQPQPIKYEVDGVTHTRDCSCYDCIPF